MARPGIEALKKFCYDRNLEYIYWDEQGKKHQQLKQGPCPEPSFVIGGVMEEG